MVVFLAWLLSVVPTTVRESATPDSKENKQADAIGSRLFSKAFSVWRVVVKRAVLTVCCDSTIRPCLNVEIESVHKICLVTDSVDISYFGSKRPYY